MFECSGDAAAAAAAARAAARAAVGFRKNELDLHDCSWQESAARFKDKFPSIVHCLCRATHSFKVFNAAPFASAAPATCVDAAIARFADDDQEAFKSLWRASFGVEVPELVEAGTTGK